VQLPRKSPCQRKEVFIYVEGLPTSLFGAIPSSFERGNLVRKRLTLSRSCVGAICQRRKKDERKERREEGDVLSKKQSPFLLSISYRKDLPCA